MATGRTGYKDAVIIWERPDKYFGRRTPCFSYTIYDDDETFPVGNYKDPNNETFRDMVHIWSQPGQPTYSMFEYYGDPAFIGVLGSPGCEKVDDEDG